ncbi:MAG: c-type cytochrome [Aquificales bacterium]|nr:c-type cytochrome [Aquificales bacterium]
MKNIIFFILLASSILLLAGCGSAETGSVEPVAAQPAANNEQGNGFMGMGNGMGGGMMSRHHAVIPEEYAGFTNPISADEASIERGGEIYTAQCASCHGDGGVGDGPAGVNLDPAPANIAHTSQMLGDDYMYWRISEGGAMAPFNSTMISWKSILEEDDRWDVINYVQALGSGGVTPGQHMGGAAFDPAVEAAKQEEMLAEAVAQGVITEAESAVFAEAHETVDGQMMQNRDAGMSGSMDDMMADVLAGLVESGELTQAQADTFLSVHDRLAEAGLMQ